MGDLVQLFPPQGFHPNTSLVESVLDRIRLAGPRPLRPYERKRIHAAIEQMWRIGTARTELITVRRIVRALDWAGENWPAKTGEIFDQGCPGSYNTLQRCLRPMVEPELLPGTVLCAMLILQPQDVSRYAAYLVAAN